MIMSGSGCMLTDCLRRILLASIVSAFLLASSQLAFPQETDKAIEVKPGDREKSDPRAGKKLAFIVGIEDYLDDEINDLEYAVDDARNFQKLLADPKRGGFEDIIMLTSDPSDEKQPTRDNIYIALNELIRRVEDQDTVVIFFSGHGYEWGNKYYLITVDTELRTLESRAIEVGEFVDKAREIAGRAKNVIIFLDSCHAGGVLQSEKGIFGKGLDYGYYKPFADAQGEVTTIASCQAAQLAYEGDGNGIFTRCLLDALDGAADNDGNGFVDLVELYNYIENEVPARVDRLYPGKKQTPIGYANLEHVNIHIARCKEPGYLTVNVRPKFGRVATRIDDEIIHESVVDYRLNPGKHQLAVQVRGYKEKESVKPFDIVPNEHHTVNVEMEPRSRSIAGLKSVISPGWGDFPDNRGRGTAMLIIQGIVLVGTLATQVDYMAKLDDYENARADYDEIIRAAKSHSSEHSYWEYRDKVELMNSGYKKAVDAKRWRDILLFASLGLRAIWGLESALLMPRAEIKLPTTVLNTENGLLTLSWESRF